MPAQTQVLTERQLELLTKAAQESDGCIEPHLHLKGGVKVRMIDFFAARGLIAQVGGQWRLTPSAYSVVQGQANLASITAAIPSPDTDTPDQELEAAVSAAEASWQAVQTKTTDRLAKLEASQTREGSKQARVIEMLKRPEGATIAQICEATSWQSHTTRGFFAGTIKKKLGLTIVSEKITGPAGAPGAGQRLYRITDAVAA